MNPPFHHVAAVSARLFDQNNLRRYCQRHSQIEGEPDNGEASSYAFVIRPDDQLDYGTRRVAQIRAVGIFMISRKMLNDSFAIEQKFECLPIDGKVFILGHNVCSAKNSLCPYAYVYAVAIFQIATQH